MENSESMEMYLETVYILEKNDGHAHVADIAERLGVSKPSVTKAMNQLSEGGYIDKESYGTINLTKKGKALAKEVYDKHIKIRLFLKHALEITEAQADENACRIEHIISDEMYKAIEKYIKLNIE